MKECKGSHKQQIVIKKHNGSKSQLQLWRKASIDVLNSQAMASPTAAVMQGRRVFSAACRHGWPHLEVSLKEALVPTPQRRPRRKKPPEAALGLIFWGSCSILSSSGWNEEQQKWKCPARLSLAVGLHPLIGNWFGVAERCWFQLYRVILSLTTSNPGYITKNA